MSHFLMQLCSEAKTGIMILECTLYNWFIYVFIYECVHTAWDVSRKFLKYQCVI